MPKLVRAGGSLAAALVSALVVPVSLAPSPSLAAPSAVPSDAEAREFSDALNRWIDGSRTLAMHMHTPFEALSAEATKLINELDFLHDTAPPLPSAEWSALLTMMSDIALQLHELPIAAHQREGGPSEAARMVKAALTREIGTTPSRLRSYRAWRQLRAASEALLSGRTSSWAEAALTVTLHERLQRLAPDSRVNYLAPTDDERTLTRDFVDVLAEMTRRTTTPERLTFVPPDFQSRFSAVIGSIGMRAIYARRITVLNHRYRELVRRRDTALSSAGSLHEAARTFEHNRDQALTARTSAVSGLARVRRRITDGWGTATSELDQLSARVARLAGHRAEPVLSAPSAQSQIFSQAAEELRAAARSPAPLTETLPRTQVQLVARFHDLFTVTDVAQRFELNRIFGTARGMLGTIAGEARLVNDERSRRIIDTVSRCFDEAPGAASAHDVELGHLNDDLDGLNDALVHLRNQFAQQRLLGSQLEAAGQSIAQSEEVLGAIDAVRFFERHQWHPALPRAAASSRWSLAEARRLRSHLASANPGAAAPIELAVELPPLPSRLRRLPMMVDSDCAPGA